MLSESLELKKRIELTCKAFDKLWDEQHEHYYNRDEISGELIRIPTSACFLPLFGQLASDKQALKIISTLEEWMKQEFLLVPSTSPFDPNYESQRYWRGPIWPHVNWMICEGLKNYDRQDLSQIIRTQTLEIISKLGIHEYYHPLGESGLGGDSFSWTAAVYLIWSKAG